MRSIQRVLYLKMQFHLASKVIQSICLIFLIRKALSYACDGQTKSIWCGSSNASEVLNTCEIEEATRIINATSVSGSNKRCNYTENPPDDYKNLADGCRVYGYFANILWACKQCSKNFEVCYTTSDKFITTSGPESTISPQTQSEGITLMPISDHSWPSSSFKTYSSPSSVGDMTWTSESHTLSFSAKGDALTNVSNVSKSHGPVSSAIPIVAITGPVCLVIVVAIVVGICMWRKRRSKENNGESDQPVSNIHPNNYMDLQDPLNCSHMYLSIDSGTNNSESRTHPVGHRGNPTDTSTEESNYLPMDGHVKRGQGTSSGTTTDESNYIPMNGHESGDNSTSGTAAEESNYISMDRHVIGDKSIPSGTTNKESNYIPMNGHMNGDVVCYHNCESEEIPSKQNYENTSIKYVTMERPEEPKSDNNGYLHVVP